MNSRKLSVRLAPLPDELLSSWFVRLAHANGDKVQCLSYRVFGREPGFSSAGDIDRGKRQRIENKIASITGVPLARVSETTLANYEGFLWGEVAARGAMSWVMPVVDHQHRRGAHGLQACSECLREPIPFYRRSWRLAFHVICPYHERSLMDRCPGCQAPLVIHRGDVGVFTPETEASVRWCSKCKADLAEDMDPKLPVDSIVLDFQSLLLDVLRRGWINIDGRVVHSVMFFEGLRMLWSFLDAPKWSSKLHRVLENNGVSLVGISRAHSGGVSMRRHNCRYELLAASAWLMEDWPTRFLATAIDSGISSHRLLHFSSNGSKQTPFWFWSPIHDVLDRSMYVPSVQEIENTLRYLQRSLGHVRVRDVCHMLNMSTNHSRRVAAAIR